MTGHLTPTPKVATAGLAGALAVVVVWVLGELGVDVPTEVAAALATIFAFAGGYLRADDSSLPRHRKE